MNRREFLKQAGVGSIALASFPALHGMLATPARPDGEQTNFHFVGQSRAATIAGVQHQIAMSGDGKVTPAQAVGGGSFVHFDNASPVPKTILGTGTWKAKRRVSLDLIGTWGVFAAGILEMEVHLVPQGGPVIAATLKMVCNLGAAGIFTGQDEGYTLTIPGAPFGPFVPLVPPLGLTVFTTVVEQKD